MSRVEQYRVEVINRMKEIIYTEKGTSKVNLSAEETDRDYIEINFIDGANMASVSTYKFIGRI